MINYDIPWNPNRLEQRMGRIHRYGQTREVTAFNFVSVDTREGSVLSRLLEKLDEIRKALGNDKVFDVVGEIIDSKWFVQLLIDAAVNARSIDEILAELEQNLKVDHEYLERIRQQLGESLATRIIDYSKIRQMHERAKEHRLFPEYVEKFFQIAFEKLNGRLITREGKIYSIPNVPYQLREIAEDQGFKKRFGELQKSYHQITFDKEVTRHNSRVEFVAFGHPLLEAIFKWVEKELSNSLQRGCVFYDPEHRYDGYIFFYEGSVQDFRGTVGAKLFAVYVSADGKEVRSISPAIIWDLRQDPKNQPVPTTLIASDLQARLKELEELAINCVIEELEKYKIELSLERRRQADIKKKYGLESIKTILCELDDKLIELERRKDLGENVSLAIQNLERRMRIYRKRKEELEKEIEQEQYLRLSKPKLKAVVLVKPENPSEAMTSDPRIEKIGMECAMEYERKSGRTPEDVSQENLGYDIRSTGPDGEIRYIEVKARADHGDVVLTENEWLAAKKFGKDYYLYIVFNAANNPELRIIRDPAKQLEPKESVRVVYFIESNQVLRVSEEGMKFGQ